MEEKEIQKNNQKVLCTLKIQEGRRKKEKTKYDIAMASGILVCAIGMLMIFSPLIMGLLSLIWRENAVLGIFAKIMDSKMLFWIFVLCGMGIITSSAFYMRYALKQKNAFKNSLRRRCFNDALKIFGDIQWFEHDKLKINEESKVGLTNDFLSKSGLFGDFNQRTIDDEFKGCHNGNNFAISETYMWYQSGRYGLPVFKGIIIQFCSNKKVLNRTIVSTKRDLTKKNTVIIPFAIIVVYFLSSLASSIKTGNMFLICFSLGVFVLAALTCIFVRKKEEPLNKVVLEDPKFSKKFDVNSSDQVEARYLVTPSFMERLNQIKTAYGTNKIKCSFFEDKFMLAISTDKDLFELGKLDEVLNNKNNINNVKVFYKEIKSIYDIMDYFKLDEKTGI